MSLQAGQFLSRQLEQALPRLYEKRFPSKWAAEGMYFPSVAGLEMGARSVIEETITEVGEAAIMADGANDIPISEALIEESPFKAVCIATYFKYSVQELDASSKAGRDIRATRMVSARRRMVEREHKLAVFGSANHEMQGFFNGVNVPLVSSAYDPNSATTDDHITFVADNLTRVEDSSNQVEGIQTIMVPAKLHNIWTKALIPGTSTTVIRHLLEAFGTESGGTLRRIIKINECRAADLEANGVKTPGTNEDRVVFSPDDPEALERRFYGMQSMEPQLFGMDYRVYMYSGTSEMIDHYPESCLYVDITQAN